MPTDTRLDYFYPNEAEQFSFYRIPKSLYTDNRFRKLSAEAKMLYGLMLDRMGLSMKNSWIDLNGHVFIYFTLENAMEWPRKSRAAVCRTGYKKRCRAD